MIIKILNIKINCYDSRNNNDGDNDSEDGKDNSYNVADIDDIIPEYMRLIDICKIYLIEPN